VRAFRDWLVQQINEFVSGVSESLDVDLGKL
jgi:hypothetical protein